MNIFQGDVFRYMMPQSKGAWSKLQHIDLSHTSLFVGDLKDLRECAPNLSELAPTDFSDADFDDLALFQSQLRYRPTSSLESLVATTLIKCPHLTNLQLHDWMPLRPESWITLTDSHLITNLRHLSIHRFKNNQTTGYDPIDLDQVVTRFICLESLIIHVSVGVKLKQVKSCFKSLDVLPQLRRLVLKKEDEVKFDWDVDRGINTDTYRIRPIQTTLNNTSTTVPADRLVGVETNPGPFRSTSTSSSSPHSLFKDGLLMIYSYLSTRDWVSAFQVCHHWYAVTSSERCRHISIPVLVESDSIPIPPPHLVQHVTTYHSRPEPQSSFRHVSQFLTLTRSLPRLASIIGYFNQTVDDVNLSDTNIDWPVSLTSLSINTVNEDIMIPLVRSLTNVPQLTRLTLLPHYSDNQFERFLSQVVTPSVVGQHLIGSATTHSPSLTSPRYMNWSELTSQLIEMNVFHGRSFTRLIPSVNGAWSKLQRLDLSSCALKGSDLVQLHACAPNLPHLSPDSFWSLRSDFEPVALFRSLETIRVYFQVANSAVCETLIVNTLLKCTNLNNLQLVGHSMLLKSESWSSLCSSHLRTQLIHLEIHWSSSNCLPGFPPIELEKILCKFTELRSLDIVLGEGVDEDSLKISFNSPDVLPKLRRFVLMDDYWRILFSWNLDQGINVNNYRRPRLVTTTTRTNTSVTVPADRLVGIETNPGPGSKGMPSSFTGTSSFTANTFKDGIVIIYNINKEVQFEWNMDQVINVHSYRIPPKLHVKKVDVLATRLVGVEENPGPSADLPTHERPRAQTIFNDGLYLIYSYLTPHDFGSCLCTCCHWSSCGVSAPSLHLPWRIVSTDGPIPPPPIRLRHHFTELISFIRDPMSLNRRERPASLTVNHLISIGRILPGLRTIDCQVCDSSTTRTAEATPINPSPYLCSWPSALTSLSMNVEVCKLDVPQLIRAILHGCTNLIRLRFKELRINPDHLAAFSKLHQLTELKSLRMYFARADQSASCDVLREMKLSRLPLKLTLLYIYGGERGIFVLASLAQLPPTQLQVISCTNFKVGDLARLVICAPNLKTIMVTQCPLSDLVDLAKFEALQSIHFSPPYSIVRDQVQLTPQPNEEYEACVINGLINCHHLTCLSLCAWCPTSLTSWLRLSESFGKKLLRLEFIWTHPPSLDALPPFESLRTLRFKGINSRAKFTNIQNYFRSSHVLPNLQLLELTASHLQSDWTCQPWSWSKESKNNDAEDYRVGQLPHTHHPESIPVTIPPARLVGIEPNPGPFGQQNPSLTHSIPSSTGIAANISRDRLEQNEHFVDGSWSIQPSSSPKSQTLFRDGLLQIYSYLNHHDWSVTLRTCHHWYEVTRSEPCRYLSDYLFMSLQQLSKSAICHHFNSLTNGQAITNEIQMDHQDLPTLFRLLPKLSSLEVKLLAPMDDTNLKSPTSNRIKWKFPKNLTDLSINFIYYTKFMQFIPIIFQATQLQKLSLQQLPACDSSDFKSLKDLIHLTSFSITQNSNLNYVPPDVFQLLTQTQLCQLKTLNLFQGQQNGLLKYLSKMKLPQMIELNLESVTLEEKELTSLCSSAPNIQILRCRCLPLFGLSYELWCLEHLHTLSFHDAPHWRHQRLQRVMVQFGDTDDDDGSDHDSGDEDEDNKVIYAITKCHQLRTLEFKDCTIDSRYFGLSELLDLNLTTLSFGASWSLEDAIDFALPFHTTLTSLKIDTRFRWDRHQRSIQSIKELTELKYLKLVQHTTHAKTDSTIESIRDYFDECRICPALSQLLLYQISTGGRMSDVFEFDRRKQIHTDLNEYRVQTNVTETTTSVTHESDHEPSDDEDEHDDKEKRSGPMKKKKSKNKNKKKHKK